jgi:sirohydrochlorin ferrochelatase
MMKTAILLMAHGSRIEEANNDARYIADMVRGMTGFEIVEVAYREMHEPNIQQGVDICVSMGAERILMMPYFLFMGAHVLKDLPHEITAARNRYPFLILEMGHYLGVHPKLAELQVERIQESMEGLGWS